MNLFYLRSKLCFWLLRGLLLTGVNKFPFLRILPQLLNRVTELEATLDQVRNEAQNRRKEVDYLEQQLGMRRDTEIEVHRQQRDLTDELESLQTEVANLKTKL